ncbi:MAG: CPBP family intramembrane metalloprotease [Alphaproteobacteria bacterium]|nr:CPBP family intramembrane metalloprotease [Alphaproteobacteria bacterium]
MKQEAPYSSSNCLAHFPDILIALALLSFWLFPAIVGYFFCGASIFTACIFKRVNEKGLFWLFLFFGLIYLSSHYYLQTYAIIFHASVIVIAVLLYLQKLPGFSNPLYWNHACFSKECSPYSQNFCWQLGVVAFLFLIFFHKPATTFSQWLMIGYWTSICLIAVISTLIMAGLLVGYIKVDIKFPPTTLFWCVHNLLFVCIAEETLFRGYIQSYLMKAFEPLYAGNYLALLIASAGFGLLHYQGGITYIVLAFVAGLFYGFSYLQTGCIEASILCHFGLNAFHFLFFSYPYYQPLRNKIRN